MSWRSHRSSVESVAQVNAMSQVDPVSPTPTGEPVLSAHVMSQVDAVLPTSQREPLVPVDAMNQRDPVMPAPTGEAEAEPHEDKTSHEGKNPPRAKEQASDSMSVSSSSASSLLIRCYKVGGSRAHSCAGG